MAIEIFYKTKTEKNPQTSIVFYILIFFLAVILLGTAILFFLTKSLDKKISETKNKIVMTLEEIQLNKDLQKIKDQADGFKKILSQHKFSSNTFSFLEKTTLDKIVYSSFVLDGEKNNLTLVGVADGLETLDQQINYLKNQNFVNNLNLKKASLNQQQKVDFEIQIDFDPKIFNSFIQE